MKIIAIVLGIMVLMGLSYASIQIDGVSKTISGITGLDMGSGTKIESIDGRIIMHNVSRINTKQEQGFFFQGASDYKFYGPPEASHTQYSTKIEIFSNSQVDDGTGATSRAELNFWSTKPGTSNPHPNNALLRIHTHNGIQNGQTDEVTFYCNVKNNSNAGKCLEWRVGAGTDGIMRLGHTNRILFPESYSGYNGNSPYQRAGLISNDERLTIITDYNGDDTAANSEFSYRWGPSEVLRWKVHGTGTMHTFNTTFLYGGGDGQEIIRFGIDRPWSFYQKNTGPDSSLQLRNNDNNKMFRISNHLGNDYVRFYSHTTGGSTGTRFYTQGTQGSAVSIDSTSSTGTALTIDAGTGRALEINSNASHLAPLMINSAPSNKAIAITTNNKICLNGNACEVYLVYNGSCIITSNNPGVCI